MPNPINVVTESDEPRTTRGGSSYTFPKNGKASGEPACNPDGVHDLRGIDFVEQVREPVSFDPVRRHELIQGEMATWRQIFLDGLTRQICLARDPDFRYPRQQFVESDGIKKPEIAYVAPDPWWFEQESTVFLRLNFGERNWCMKGKNPLIRIGTMDELMPTLEKLHILIEAREFDEIIEKMVIVSPR
jgi:hypothetical protein